MQNQPDAHIPNVVGSRSGWYPRWWLLAALLFCIIMVIGMLLWTPVICPDQQHQPLICSVTSLPYLLQVLLIWLIFFLCWFPLSIFGISLVEVPRRDYSLVGSALRSISQFSALHPMLLIQGGVALVLLDVMWWLSNSPPDSFAFLGIIVFLAHCSFFQRLDPRVRRSYFIGYGVLALIAFTAQALLRRDFFSRWPTNDEWPLISVEVVLFIIGIVAVVLEISRPRRAAQLTAQQARNANINQVASPFNVLRSMYPFSRIFPMRPPVVNRANQPPPGNPDPGAP